MAVLIKSVIKKSAAGKCGIKPDDVLFSINGSEISDVLDYMFYSAETNVNIIVLRNGVKLDFHIVKSEYEDLGMEFDTFLMDKKQSCRNKCIFCFIDQLPTGMRETLYFKDDDARLSFLQGNYVTLTNLNQSDIDRIIKMRLGINISVHTTNPELRCRMMNNPSAGEKLEYIKQLSDAGIKMNCQIVLCPGINDGKELENTLNTLGGYMPNIRSIAAVPAGLTKFREGLYPLERFNKISAGETLRIIRKYQSEFLKKWESRVVFAADEFYLLAGQPFPKGYEYEDYCQYENGVGMLRSLSDEFIDAVENINDNCKDRNISIAAGTASYEFIRGLIEIPCKKWHNIHCSVYPVVNDFFGDTITVTGLLTGQDIIAQLSDKPLGDELLLSDNIIKKDSELFLDDYTVSDVEKALNTKIRLVRHDGYELLNAVLGI